jgi:CHRD domain
MRSYIIRCGVAGLAIAAFLGSGAVAVADIMHFKADLSGKNEVPPSNVKGTGKVEATYDTASKKLTWTLTYSGLTGPAIAAHFHGPASPKKNAPVAVLIGNNISSPAKGSKTLTAAQAADLMSGRWYVNVHTAAHKPGEIRGQVMKGM